jgi:hypothetical protein
MAARRSGGEAPGQGTLAAPAAGHYQGSMARPGPRVEADIARFTTEVQQALGDALVCLVLHGSAAGDDWVAARSDVNTALVVPHVELDVLDALAPIVARWHGNGFALPVLMDHDYLAHARDVFPMELDDIRRQHRLLAGRDVFGTLELDPAALRRECESEARGKLLRLRAQFLLARTPAAIEHLMVAALKSFLVLLRHLLRLRGDEVAPRYADVLAAGERALGPLPSFRRLLAHRTGDMPLGADAVRAEFGRYLADVERIVTAVDALGA